jgi:hypothetical protein
MNKVLARPVSEVYPAGVQFSPLTSQHDIYLVGKRTSGHAVHSEKARVTHFGQATTVESSKPRPERVLVQTLTGRTTFNNFHQVFYEKTCTLRINRHTVSRFPNNVETVSRFNKTFRPALAVVHRLHGVREAFPRSKVFSGADAAQ